MSSGQEYEGLLALLPGSGIIVYCGSPGEVGSASRAGAIHLLESTPACCRTWKLGMLACFFEKWWGCREMTKLSKTLYKVEISV